MSRCVVLVFLLSLLLVCLIHAFFSDSVSAVLFTVTIFTPGKASCNFFSIVSTFSFSWLVSLATLSLDVSSILFSVRLGRKYYFRVGLMPFHQPLLV